MIAFAARLHTRAADAVEVFQRRQKFRQILRVILQIGVEREEIFAARGLETGEARRALAAVECKFLHADARVSRREFLEDFPGLVLAAIVGDDDLVGNLQRLDRRSDGLDEFAQIAFLVVTTNDEADFRSINVHRKIIKPQFYKFPHSSEGIFLPAIISARRASQSQISTAQERGQCRLKRTPETPRRGTVRARRFPQTVMNDK